MSFLSTLLSSYAIPILKQGFSIGLDWLGHFARIIIEGVGIIGAGIIVFTLVLKAITLPFDIYQRVKMRKQSLTMEKMKPELERMQEMYADDKDMYNRKMQELYKKNGYNILGACLPTIVSLIILIFAFQGFRAYSQYANLNMYVSMSEAYNSAILEHGIEFKQTDGQAKNFRLHKDDVDDDELTIYWTSEGWTEGTPEVTSKENKDDAGNTVSVVETTTKSLTHTENGIVYTWSFITTVTTVTGEEPAKEEKNILSVWLEDNSKYIYYTYSLDENTPNPQYFVDGERLKKTEKNFQSEYMTEGVSEEMASKAFVKKMGATAAADYYHENDAHFLWVKNVWYPDVSYEHPIQDYSKFSSNFKGVKVTYADGTEKSLINELDSTAYGNLVSELTEETGQANGYFVLIILSIGLMLLSQFVSMRSNKATNKYQTVDGSSASQQKIMMIMMPLIYAFFAFMYSAAFSIYMIISSAVSLVVTLICNAVLGVANKTKEIKEEKQQTVRRLPWMKDDYSADKKELKEKKQKPVEEESDDKKDKNSRKK